jgi:Flp pilus assembly pilin Flp
MWWLKQLVRREEAATAIEYAIMLGMILLVAIGAIGTVGTNANSMWTRIFNSLKSIVFGG